MSGIRETNLLTFALLTTVFLSGCGANHYSIHHVDKMDSGDSMALAVDAKQRFLLSNVVTRTRTVGNDVVTERLRRYCAEPSPDVFSVLSQAGSGSGTFGQTANPQSLNVALNAAFSSSEAGATVSRTQTINMLKEMMYRTCESYLNGQIDEAQYPIIAARDQRIMASILAIEQLTGTVLPKSVTVGTTESPSTGKSTSDSKPGSPSATKSPSSSGTTGNASTGKSTSDSKPGSPSATTDPSSSSSSAPGTDKQIGQTTSQAIQDVAQAVKDIVVDCQHF